MDEDNVRFKAEWQYNYYQKTGDGDRKMAYEIIYRQTRYVFTISFSELSKVDWDNEDLEDLFKTIARELTLNQCSLRLHQLLTSRVFFIMTFPKEKYSSLSDIPNGGRQRKHGSTSHLLNNALESFLVHNSDTPNRDELWEWLQTNDLMRNGYGVTLQGDTLLYGYGNTLTYDTYKRKFNDKIGTKSYRGEFDKERKKFSEKLQKKPRGRPRKYPPKKTHK